jgi:hypothetical protein
MSAQLRPVAWVIIVSAVFAAGATAACESQSTAPTPIRQPAPPTTSNPPDPTGPVRFTGVVRNDRGAPLADATIQLVSTTPAITVVSDANGRYELTGTVRLWMGYEMKAEKPGFEFTLQYVQSGSSTQDFQLRDIVRVSAGDAKTVTLAPSDSFYGLDLEWRRRTMRLVAPRSGVVDLEVVPEHATAPGVIGLSPVGEFPCCPSRRSVSVAAGAEVSIHVLTYWNNLIDQTFTLRTAYLP